MTQHGRHKQEQLKHYILVQLLLCLLNFFLKGKVKCQLIYFSGDYFFQDTISIQSYLYVCWQTFRESLHSKI